MPIRGLRLEEEANKISPVRCSRQAARIVLGPARRKKIGGINVTTNCVIQMRLGRRKRNCRFCYCYVNSTHLFFFFSDEECRQICLETESLVLQNRTRFTRNSVPLERNESSHVDSTSSPESWFSRIRFTGAGSSVSLNRDAFDRATAALIRPIFVLHVSLYSQQVHKP